MPATDRNSMRSRNIISACEAGRVEHSLQEAEMPATDTAPDAEPMDLWSVA